MLNSTPNAKKLSLSCLMLVMLFIFPAGSAHANWPEQAKLTAADAAADDYFGFSVSVNGDYAIVGATGDDDNGSFSGSAYIFYNDGTSWNEQAKLLAADGAAIDYFGCSVSIDGDHAIVGSYGDESYTGSAYVFTRNGTSWSAQAKLLALDGAFDDNFGYSVSVSGDYAVVGIKGNGSSSGSAYIFYRNHGGVDNWGQQGKLTPSDASGGADRFGYSVSISGDYVVVGASAKDSINGAQTGAAYIYNRIGTNWSEQSKLAASDGASYDSFGHSVSIDGDYTIVGAQNDDDNGDGSGSAFIFHRSGTSWSEEDKLLASDGTDADLFGMSVSISGSYAVVGAWGNDDSGGEAGASYIFKRSGTVWMQQKKLLASDGFDDDHFGNSVSLSGDHAIVGGVYDDDNGTNSGSAYIFEGLSDICGTKWYDTDADFVKDTDEQVLQDWRIYIDENENGQFDAGEVNDITDSDGNYALTVPGGTYLVSEEGRACWEQSYPGGDGNYSVTVEMGEIATGYNFGNARPTEIYPSVWKQDQQDKLLAADGAAGDSFGNSVSISGDYAIVGAYGDDDNGSSSGSAYIFAPNDVNCNDWDQLAKLTASDGAAGDYFGISVSVSGDYAIVGAHWDDDNGSASGSAYIFYYNGTSWSQQAKLTASDAAGGDLFGKSVSISGDYAIVGAYGDDDNGSNSGSAYIFKRDGTNWSQQDKLLASDGTAGDAFGNSVSISGDYAVVGAWGDDDNGSSSGSACIFKRSGTSWYEQAKLTASDAVGGDRFGISVSLSGDYAIVGAYYDDDNGTDSGSAYIFKRSGTSWYEQAKLVAADGAGDDWFGYSVSVSGAYAIVGAYADDDNGNASGSAYVFERDGISWSQQNKLLASDGTADAWFGYSVSVSGDYAIAGALFDDDSGSNSGSAYMFGKILCPTADLTGDCFVDIEDFAEMAGQWLQGVE